MRKAIAVVLIILTLSLGGCGFSSKELEDAKREAYREGYTEGFEEGYEAGSIDGYNQAREDAKYEFGIELP